MAGRKMARRLTAVASDPGACTGVRELAEWALRAEGDGADLADLEEIVVGLADRIDAEMVELPKDKDGAPIHIGDTVCDPSGSDCTVISLHLYGEEAPSWMADVDIRAYGQTVTARRGQSELTHELPDSWERIADDVETLVWLDDEDEERSRRELAARIRRMAWKDGKSDD